MTEQLYITKRDNTKQMFDAAKINKVCEWACEGLDNVYASEVVMQAKLKFFDGIKSSDIHESLVKSAADLITVEASDYQYVAARLLVFKLRKEAYGKYNPINFYDHVVNGIKQKRYDKHILEDYTKKEIKQLEETIDHDKDLAYSYAAMRQWQRKYLAQDRTNNIVFESPQYAIMLISMCLFAESSNRLEKVTKFYEAVSNKKISLPTPIMGGVRTPTRQFSSCTLINSGDSLESITEANRAIVNYVSKRAGIGLNIGAIRAEGEPINSGEAVHTGLLPFIKMFQAAVKSCSQGGIRNGAATLNYPVWHLEFENLIVLKNNRGVEDNRARHVDYVVHLNKLFYDRLIAGGEITLFSPNVADGKLYEYFYSDQKAFKKLYEKLEKDPSVRKKTKTAMEVFGSLLTERSGTGRIYMMNVDHVNEYGAFNPLLAPVNMTNLCLVGDTQVKVLINDNEYKVTTLKEVNDMFASGVKLKVLSYNEDDKTNSYNDITNSALMRKEALLMKVTDEDTGKSIICTPEHKVYTQNRGYVEAKDLKLTDTLLIN